MNRAEQAEFVLLAYHHLITLQDVDDLRAGEYQPPAKASLVYPPNELRPDTEKTAYLHNHVPRQELLRMTPLQKADRGKQLAVLLKKGVVG